MVFRFVHDKQSPNGASERKVTEFAKSELTFGRGGASDVLLANPKLGAVHAKFSWQDGQLFVADLGALVGVRVNGRRVSRSALQDGDRVVLGDVELLIKVHPQEVEITYVETPKVEVAEDELVARTQSSLRVESYLPRMSVISTVVAVVAGILFFILPVSTQKRDGWSTGPVSNAHKLIERDCVKCHSESFTHVQDKDCTSCHSMSEHARGIGPFVEKHAALSVRCAQCHMEHNGDQGLIVRDERQCASCHANMTSLKPDASVENVKSFDSHPEFKVEVKDAQGVVSRISLSDSARAIDSSQIKLNHKLHLKKDLRGKDGFVTLECKSCHRLNSDFKTLEPISFDKDCRDCHSLAFDERLPNVEVPHGDAEQVYPALFAEYTKVVLLHDDESMPNAARDMKRDMVDVDNNPQEIPGPATVETVVKNARDAEKQLFTKTGCFLCHSYSEKPEQDKTPMNSHYQILDPAIPSVWFKAARFSHGAHEEFTCESCHSKTRESSKTSDLLLPNKQLCQECHSSASHKGYVRSDCVECHSYHDALGMPVGNKQDIKDYLHHLIR